MLDVGHNCFRYELQSSREKLCPTSWVLCKSKWPRGRRGSAGQGAGVFVTPLLPFVHLLLSNPDLAYPPDRPIAARYALFGQTRRSQSKKLSNYWPSYNHFR